jgi:maleate cis-trans isomerase
MMVQHTKIISAIYHINSMKDANCMTTSIDIKKALNKIKKKKLAILNPLIFPLDSYFLVQDIQCCEDKGLWVKENQ